MPDNPYWSAAKAAYNNGDRSWLPCTEEFFEDMLGVVPPVCFDHHPTMGCHFGVGEIWDHTSVGQPIYLMFRSRPEIACRMATVPEFITERSCAMPKNWITLTPGEVTAVCERVRSGEREKWESQDFKQGTERMCLEAVYKSVACIAGAWWVEA